ncbi:protein STRICTOSIDINE SYNTHASE-LIKE 5-like [Andrographis paniculata]|uniref:protein STRICTOSIDINE SYNTHASE-LIKE 5-like n=1 Tax=Andrographis paniculata TaxID=175694 RepID=UPI0021E8D4A0|nr:protein STRICTOSIDINE SYNTHASE-LIKE 5-like [Andrographis paniculata]
MARIRRSSGVIIAVFPVLAAVFVHRIDAFDAAAYPDDELVRIGPPLVAPRQNAHMLLGSEKLGDGELAAPEDIAWERKTGAIYTGGEDGWVSRISLGVGHSPAVKKWVNTGGRPQGIAHGLHGEVIVADAYKGLLNISKDGVIQLLTDEAEGLKFKLIDDAATGPHGTIFFTDASSKYDLHDYLLDIFEGTPNGRFLRYDPATKQTTVLLDNLYFPNGVVLSSDKTHLIFCESPMCRCKRYYIEGSKKGTVEIFVENLPGLPDNIKYDGKGHYWIALGSDAKLWRVAQRNPWMRQLYGTMEKYKIRPTLEKNAGVFVVDLNGKPVAHYYDPKLYHVSTGIQIGDNIYLGSTVFPYIVTLNISRYPATLAP